MPKKLHALKTAAQAIAPMATLFTIVFALAFFSPLAPAASMAAMSSEDKSKTSHSEPFQTVDSLKPTNITSRNVALQTSLL
jgi:ABC-type oligopeptide transport system substrate-binding subunit